MSNTAKDRSEFTATAEQHFSSTFQYICRLFTLQSTVYHTFSVMNGERIYILTSDGVRLHTADEMETEARLWRVGAQGRD